jgi:hemoglobin
MLRRTGSDWYHTNQQEEWTININLMTAESLYKRMGGYDIIAAIADDFLVKLVAHEKMQRFFYGASESTRTQRRQYIVDFLCAKTGGPCAYTGRSMKDSHKGLGISDDDWNNLVDFFLESLKKFGLQQKETEELMEFIASLRSEIVEK